MSPSAKSAGGRRVTRWTRETIIEKIREWNELYGEPPCSADWNPSNGRFAAFVEGQIPSRDRSARHSWARQRASDGFQSAEHGGSP